MQKPVTFFSEIILGIHFSISIMFSLSSGYYLINVQMYSLNGQGDYTIKVNDADLSRSRDISQEADNTIANGQIVYELKIGDTVKIVANLNTNMYGSDTNSYFHITLIYAL